MFKYALGTEIKSKITNFKGTILSRMIHNNGCIRYWVLPKAKQDGTLSDGSWVDEYEIVVTNAKNAVVTLPKFTIAMDSEVKSIVSNFRGIVYAQSETLHGVNRYNVQPKIGKDGKLPEGYWFDECELEVIKKPVKKKESKERKTPPGGFASKLC